MQSVFVFFNSVADSLFANFLECMQSHASDRRLFDTVADFIQNCQDTIDLLNEHESKRSKITFKVLLILAIILLEIYWMLEVICKILNHNRK